MLIKIMRIIMRIFYVFPVRRNKVVLQAYNGRLYACSPKYITEALSKIDKYDVYYALNKDSRDALPSSVRRIDYRSIKHFYHLMTAGFVVFNSTGITGFLPYRKQQIIIQTWHGGYSFKVIGNEIFTDEKSKKNRKLSGSQITYFLSSSKVATKQHSSAMSVDMNKFLNIGLPRNDILFFNHEAIQNIVFKKLGISTDRKIVLYAPTYRDGPVKAMTEYGIEQIDTGRVVEALNKRFNANFIFVYKAHHDMIPTNIGENCVNASDYSDIQELMCVADVIITDYSSCMADFALQRKAGFLFTPDIEEYEAVHPFSMKPQKWPYSFYKSNSELIHAILSYNENDCLHKIENFFNEIGNCDTGHATAQLIHIMDQKIERIVNN